MPHQLTANKRIKLCAYKNYLKVVKLRKVIQIYSRTYFIVGSNKVSFAENLSEER